MKQISLAVMVVFAFATTGCTPTQKGAVVGGAAGAAVGTVVADGNNHKKGAIIGGAVGAAAGAMAGRAQEKRQGNR